MFKTKCLQFQQKRKSGLLQQKLVCFTTTDPSRTHLVVVQSAKVVPHDLPKFITTVSLQIMFVILDTWSVKLHRSVFEKNGLIFICGLYKKQCMEKKKSLLDVKIVRQCSGFSTSLFWAVSMIRKAHQCQPYVLWDICN